VANQIVADAFVSPSDVGVELVALVIVPGGEEGFDRVDDDMQRGRLERFEEALRQTDCEAVADPTPLHPAAAHLKVSDLSVFAQAEMVAQLGGGIVRIDIAARIDVAIADAVGERDVPDPSGRLGR